LGRKTKYKLDLRGLLIPLSLLKVTQGFRALKPGETLEVLWGEPESPQEVLKVLPHASYEVIEMQEQKKANRYYRIQLQKKETAGKDLNLRILPLPEDETRSI
jgi:TusA-related sulfurtransferase